MLKGWEGFEGAGCVCHREQNCLGKSLEINDIKPIISKIKGVCAHFHRSHKVILCCNTMLFFIIKIICDINFYSFLCRAITIYVRWEMITTRS